LSVDHPGHFGVEAELDFRAFAVEPDGGTDEAGLRSDTFRDRAF
jgi:hypothetical protein